MSGSFFFSTKCELWRREVILITNTVQKFFIPITFWGCWNVCPWKFNIFSAGQHYLFSGQGCAVSNDFEAGAAIIPGPECSLGLDYFEILQPDDRPTVRDTPKVLPCNRTKVVIFCVFFGHYLGIGFSNSNTLKSVVPLYISKAMQFKWAFH